MSQRSVSEKFKEVARRAEEQDIRTGRRKKKPSEEAAEADEARRTRPGASANIRRNKWGEKMDVNLPVESPGRGHGSRVVKDDDGKFKRKGK